MQNIIWNDYHYSITTHSIITNARIKKAIESLWQEVVAYATITITTTAFKYFDNITIDQYKEYASKFNKWNWNLRNESIKYCLNDCIALYQVLVKFNELYFNKFHININEHPTLSSHAMRLFRTHFMNDNEIPMIYGEEHDIIRTSYSGGATDMYIPTNDTDELVYGYDANSLYPYVMANYDMPVGIKTYFNGDITKFKDNPFGFFNCEVEAPTNLKHPILQLHVNTKKGPRTISPVGTFKGLIFSEEMNNAIKFGYKFKIISGYTFEKKCIFKDYVDTLYKLRLEYPKDHPMNFIAKLFLNSLYGRFGMRYLFDTINILSTEEFTSFSKIANTFNKCINDIVKLDDRFLVQYQHEIDPAILEKKDFNVNISIASAITSYARVYMSQFKNNPKLKLFYTDTDSIYTNLNPTEMNELFHGIVSNTGLGKLKLETVSKKAVFISPKCYCLNTIDGKTIYKVKGLAVKQIKVPLTVTDFESLLDKDHTIERLHTKSYKSLTKGSIFLLEQTYTLQQTDNKRELVYNDNNKLVNTRPYTIIDNKINL